MSPKMILVTGGAGHVGSHVIEELLLNSENKVVSLDSYFNGSEANHIAGAEYIRGHTKDIETLVTGTPDLILHLGEYARISTSFDDVALVHDMNTVGTFAVAEFCRKRKVPKLVYVASSTKFADGGRGRHQNPYSFSKATNVELITNYGDWYDLPFAICYLYNGFGPRERGDGRYATLIARFEHLYRTGQRLQVVLPGTQRRAFTHVKDLARGIVLVGEFGHGDGYALGATMSYSVLEIAQAFGSQYDLVAGYSGRSDATIDPSKARNELGWQATLDVMNYIRSIREQNARR